MFCFVYSLVQNQRKTRKEGKRKTKGNLYPLDPLTARILLEVPI